ncbi:inactive phospholipase D5 isoform X2 [Protopterus annectens]|uniref:inactive phospholipase D5 isoform X2 n=1 Tax=Protopterus annectens TaxID=7888 RepID=UPI001CFB84C3|nr:inactive phospholipase D5 isoform X2 [Protopterus annectens]
MSQQKCVVVFALMCCFAVLVALIFSAVDVVGEDEDRITENCHRNFRAVLVENIPEGLSYTENAPFHLSLFQGWMNLLDMAEKSVYIVSSSWNLNESFSGYSHPLAWQGQQVLQKLLELKSRNIELKLVSDSQHTGLKELRLLEDNGAEIHYLNMSVLTGGTLRTSFWVVDKKHTYIGSANTDWRSLGQMKELGIIIYNCSCIVLDIHRIFTLYGYLRYKDFIPDMWSKRVYALFHKNSALKGKLNETEVEVFLSNSPKSFCPRDRATDLDAIQHVIEDAKKFVYVSVMDYLPLVYSGNNKRYWSVIDEKLRDALVLRNISVRLLISHWKETHPLTFNFALSLKALCTELPHCNIEVKFFAPEEQKNASFPRVNHNKYVVTDRAAYFGNFNWVGNDFCHNAGSGLVIKKTEASINKNETIVEQLKAVFERDWYSSHSKNLQKTHLIKCVQETPEQPEPKKINGDSPDISDNNISQ